MSSKAFAGLITILVMGTIGYIAITQKSKPKEAIIGVQHTKQGENHIAAGQPHDAYNSDPASSGPHYADSSAPTPWGVYTQLIPDEVFLHNEEHGGVVVTYKPDLPTNQIKSLRALFAAPYSDKSFEPNKAVVTARPQNTHAIELASWTWTLSLDQYDEAAIKKFYLQHVGKSPEAAAGPSTRQQVNQAEKTQE